NFLFGFIVFAVFSMFNYRLLMKSSLYLYIAGNIMLVGVLFTPKVNGAHSWFHIPGSNMDFQPAELVKFILIITITSFLSRNRGETLEFVRDVIPIGLVVSVPFFLDLIQPDLGNAIVYLVILAVMYWIGNIKYLHAFIGIVSIVVILGLFINLYSHYHDELYQYVGVHQHDKQHWLDRIDTFLDPSKVSSNKSWQVDNSIRAIGSGGLSGEGYLHGDSVRKGFIPFTYADSIFVVIGEEFGFIGSALLLLLYFLLIYRMILISIQTTDRRGSYMIVGIVAMFVFQVFQNIGMMIGLIPLTGITLPFISYGGTSLFINMMSIGLVMSVKLHSGKQYD
ncbi:MAG: cell cycle protein, partial [Paenibacillus sp. RIFOXYA1_FULL_44_5]